MLRQQEYIELVRGQKCLEAVYHARKYFVNLTPQQMTDVQKSMVLLAYVKNSDGFIYQVKAGAHKSESKKIRFSLNLKGPFKRIAMGSVG
jgi:hypothetical protein